MIGHRDAERLGGWSLLITFFALAGLAGGGGDKPIVKPTPQQVPTLHLERHDKWRHEHNARPSRGTH